MFEIEFSRTRPGSVRAPVVAGLFYPDDPHDLRGQVQGYLDEAEVPQDLGRVIAIVSPHAGYQYSGKVAAHGFRLLARQAPTRIVVVAPCHVDGFSGASVFSGSHYATPLGNIPVDRNFVGHLAAGGGAAVSERGHLTARGGRGEHSLEVQLPFLQTILSQFTIVPIIMGTQDLETCRKLGLALADLLDEDTAIVASSDLSHYHPYSEARELDSFVVSMIRSWDYFSLLQNVESGGTEACGAGPVAVAMIAAQQLGGSHAEVLKYSSSGDVPPYRRDGVVGYLSAALVESPPETSPRVDELGPVARHQLLEICRRVLREAVRGKADGKKSESAPSGASGLDRPGAVFVTLRTGGNLRGCIGSIVAREPLTEAVRNAAISAATLDPRFPPVTESELDSIEYDISVLTPLRVVRRIDEIQIGRDGLMIEKGGRRGLLLPQVASERGWDRLEFLRHTCTKAGLDPAAWERSDAVIYRFSAQVFDGNSH